MVRCRSAQLVVQERRLVAVAPEGGLTGEAGPHRVHRTGMGVQLGPPGVREVVDAALLLALRPHQPLVLQEL